jgi:hypothetical protein
MYGVPVPRTKYLEPAGVCGEHLNCPL